MGDETPLGPGDGLPGDIRDAIPADDLGQITRGVGDTIADCDALWSSLNVVLSDHIVTCLVECQKSLDQCTACVAGEIESHYPGYEKTLSKCYAKLAAEIQNDYAYIQAVGSGVGIHPPTDTELSDRLPGVVKPLALAESTTVAPEEGQTLGGGFPPAERTPVAVDSVDILQPASQVCLPRDWTAGDVIAWATLVYGPNPRVISWPTESTSGVVVTDHGQYALPRVCLPPSSTPLPTLPGGGGTGTGTGGGGGGTGPVGGGTGGSGTGPTGGGNGGGSVLPIGCTEAGRQEAIDAAAFALPGHGELIALPSGSRCPEGYAQVFVGEYSSNDGCRYVVCQRNADLPPVGNVPDTLSGGNGNESCPCVPSVTPTATYPQEPSGPFCDPETSSGRAVLDYLSEQMRSKAPVSLVGTDKGSVVTDAKAFISGVIGGLLPGFSTLPSSVLSGAVDTLIGGLLNVSGGLINTAPCSDPLFQPLALLSVLPRIFGGLFHALPDQYTATIDYGLNYVCPYLIPGLNDADDLFTRGYIDSGQWDLLTRANGMCPAWGRIVRDGRQTVPSVGEMIAADRRDLISEDERTELWRKNGILNERWQEVFYRLSDYVPGPSDLITFMVRDVFDERTVRKYGLDTDFTEKYQGRVEAWGKAQGIDPDTFLYHWRAHWQYASPTQIFEAVHRLRPNDRDPDDPFKDITFTLEDAKEALLVQDVAPYFVDMLLATSYRPLTRVDVRRAYVAGALDLPAVRRSYLDLGYTPQAAEALVKFTELDSAPKRAKYLGLPTVANVVANYRTLALTRDDADFLLRQAGLSAEQSGNTLATADMMRAAQDRKDILAAYKRRYMSGEYGDDQITGPLIDAGLDMERITGVIKTWHIQRDAKHRGPTVAMLCTWYTRGMITIEEYYRRVGNIGYPVSDATRIVQTCVIGDQERKAREVAAAAKAAKAAQRQQEADARRLKAEQKAARKEQEAAAKAAAPCKPAPKPVCP